MEMNFKVKLRNRRKRNGYGIKESVNNSVVVGNNRNTSDIEFIKIVYNGNLIIRTLGYLRVVFGQKNGFSGCTDISFGFQTAFFFKHVSTLLALLRQFTKIKRSLIVIGQTVRVCLLHCARRCILCKSKKT